MTNTIEDSISRYITYFQSQLQIIDENCSKTRDGEIHSRILYMAILDALSTTVFINQGNRERIVSFVNKFCDWPDHERISLPHLKQLVMGKSEPKFADLQNFVIQRMSKWIPASKIMLIDDPDFCEVKYLWPSENDKLLCINGIKINQLQHSQLLYTYRNFLIHEFRTPGRHVELWDEDEPYYASLSEYESETSRKFRHTWELQYTTKFFRRLCISGLNNLKINLIENSIDPFETIDWGNYWIQNLNY